MEVRISWRGEESVDQVRGRRRSEVVDGVGKGQGKR
jgi:hypothetical protein